MCLFMLHECFQVCWLYPILSFGYMLQPMLQSTKYNLKIFCMPTLMNVVGAIFHESQGDALWSNDGWTYMTNITNVFDDCHNMYELVNLYKSNGLGLACGNPFHVIFFILIRLQLKFVGTIPRELCSSLCNSFWREILYILGWICF